MAEQGLQPGRIRIARELRGFTQADLARRLDITASAFSQFEAGATRPGPATLQKLAEALQVPPAFFAEPVVESHEGFFRSLRRTAVIDRRRARAIAQLAHDLATSRPAADILPPISLPTFPVMAFDESLDTEQIAEDTRRALHLGPGPVPHLVDLLEARGLAIIRMPLNTPD